MRILFFILLFAVRGSAWSQQVDSIYFHLYTDSLKKGQHNYINVDGKLNNGRWIPLTAREVEFYCATAVFQGNELIIPVDFSGEKVTVKATLKANPRMVIERTIWIKKLPDPELKRDGSRETGIGRAKTGERRRELAGAKWENGRTY